MSTLREEQPLPIGNDQPVIHRLVQDDLERRLRIGIETYGQPLQPFNGRDPLQDLYEELLDASCYVRQAMIERDRQVDALRAEIAALRQRLASYGDVIDAPDDPEPEPTVEVS